MLKTPSVTTSLVPSPDCANFSSTALTLLVVPVLYGWFEEKDPNEMAAHARRTPPVSSDDGATPAPAAADQAAPGGEDSRPAPAA